MPVINENEYLCHILFTQTTTTMKHICLVLTLLLCCANLWAQKAELPQFLITHDLKNGTITKSPAIPGGQFETWSKQKFDPRWGDGDRRTEIIDESLTYLKMFNDSNSVVFLHAIGKKKGNNLYYIAVLASDGVGYSIYRCHTTCYRDYSTRSSDDVLYRRYDGYEGNIATINPLVVGDNYFVGFTSYEDGSLRVTTRNGSILKIPLWIEGRPKPYYNPY